MRIFTNLTECYYEIRRDLFEVGEWIQGSTYQDKNVEGDPEFDFMELRPYTYSLTGAADRDDFIEKLNLNWAWIRTEFDERLALFAKSRNPGLAWELRKDVWEEFLEEDGRFAYVYSERFNLPSGFSQPVEVIKELRRHPASRQGVIGIYDPNLDLHNFGGHGRIPCSMFYQLMIRNGALDLHYVMRSCDFFTHFPYDQLLAIRFQKWGARRLNCKVGVFHHLITSLHGFRKDFPKGVF